MLVLLFRWIAAISRSNVIFSVPAATDALSVAERSYLTFVVRGSGRECQAATAQERPRGVTPHPRSGVAAGRSYPTPEPGAAAGRTNPMPKEPWLRGRRRA